MADMRLKPNGNAGAVSEEITEQDPNTMWKGKFLEIVGQDPAALGIADEAAAREHIKMFQLQNGAASRNAEQKRALEAMRAQMKMLTPDSPEVSKEDYKMLYQVFPELGAGVTLGEIEMHNALVNILKNRGKFKDDPLTVDEIREMATNPPGRLGKRPLR